LSDVVFSKAITSRGLERQNIVVYNPEKGLDITRRIMKHSDEQILWIPLQGMPPAQVVELFHGAKLYIDFGNHPGRDRLPREAALSGCCILVGENGSAANSDDMPIPQKYKIPKNEIGNYPIICSRIQHIISNFDKLNNDFIPYLDWIKRQKSNFIEEVSFVFQPEN
jgi:hypothetical protein